MARKRYDDLDEMFVADFNRMMAVRQSLVDLYNPRGKQAFVDSLHGDVAMAEQILSKSGNQRVYNYPLPDVFKEKYMDMVSVGAEVGTRVVQKFDWIENDSLNISNSRLPLYMQAGVVGGITDEYYGKLNGQEVYIYQKRTLRFKLYDRNGEYVTQDSEWGQYLHKKHLDKLYEIDEKTGILYQETSLPPNSVAVISEVQIGVPNMYKPKRDLPPIEQNFDYIDGEVYADVDFSDSDGERRYLYVVPETKVMPLNQVCLVMISDSRKNLSSFYQGVRLSFTDGYYIRLYIAPFTKLEGRRYTDHDKGFRLLCVKSNDNFTQEIACLYQYWVDIGLMFDPRLCAMDEAVEMKKTDKYADLYQTNTAFQLLQGTLDEYERFDTNISLYGETNFDELFFKKAPDDTTKVLNAYASGQVDKISEDYDDTDLSSSNNSFNDLL